MKKDAATHYEPSVTTNSELDKSNTGKSKVRNRDTDRLAKAMDESYFEANSTYGTFEKLNSSLHHEDEHNADIKIEQQIAEQNSQDSDFKYQSLNCKLLMNFSAKRWN